MDEPFALAGLGSDTLSGEFDGDFFPIVRRAPDGEFDISLEHRAGREKRVWHNIREARENSRRVHEQHDHRDGDAAQEETV